jgi:hypothetical protein
MGTLFLIAILLGAALALVTGVRALRAYLGFRRARAEMQRNLSEGVEDLTRRTGELERGLAALEIRAEALPVRIGRIQHNLETLRVLTSALGATLAQAQNVLSATRFKTFSATSLSGIVRSRGAASAKPTPRPEPRS